MLRPAPKGRSVTLDSLASSTGSGKDASLRHIESGVEARSTTASTERSSVGFHSGEPNGSGEFHWPEPASVLWVAGLLSVQRSRRHLRLAMKLRQRFELPESEHLLESFRWCGCGRRARAGCSASLRATCSSIRRMRRRRGDDPRRHHLTAAHRPRRLRRVEARRRRHRRRRHQRRGDGADGRGDGAARLPPAAQLGAGAASARAPRRPQPRVGVGARTDGVVGRGARGRRRRAASHQVWARRLGAAARLLPVRIRPEAGDAHPRAGARLLVAPLLRRPPRRAHLRARAAALRGRVAPAGGAPSHLPRPSGARDHGDHRRS